MTARDIQIRHVQLGGDVLRVLCRGLAHRGGIHGGDAAQQLDLLAADLIDRRQAPVQALAELREALGQFRAAGDAQHHLPRQRVFALDQAEDALPHALVLDEAGIIPGDLQIDHQQRLLDLVEDEAEAVEVARLRRLRAAHFDDQHAVRRTVADVIQLFAGRAAEKRVRLTADIPAGAPSVVCGDPTRLRQVLFNLVGNAIKFTDRGGRVTVSTEIVAGEMHVAVSDTGIGIAPEDLTRLARPFEQVEGQHSKTTQGTGLGLALTKSLIEMHGGLLAMESEPGEGTTVSFDLLDREGSVQWPCNAEAPLGTPVMHIDGFVRGKGKFILTEYIATDERTGPRYPLLLTTGRILSQYNVGAQTRRTENVVWHAEDRLEIHPHDAEQRGVRDGDWVRLASRAGETTLRAEITDRVAPGVV